jgi:hypothetical protein
MVCVGHISVFVNVTLYAPKSITKSLVHLTHVVWLTKRDSLFLDVSFSCGAEHLLGFFVVSLPYNSVSYIDLSIESLLKRSTNNTR